jgi:hypothetical protein
MGNEDKSNIVIQLHFSISKQFEITCRHMNRKLNIKIRIRLSPDSLYLPSIYSGQR